ncbi:hypothetical protein RZS08_02870, partial [Arthrospira platensis SPKY1]|nr:hypothetical protein [Arthrospira platensis SPKY1]
LPRAPPRAEHRQRPQRPHRRQVEHPDLRIRPLQPLQALQPQRDHRPRRHRHRHHQHRRQQDPPPVLRDAPPLAEQLHRVGHPLQQRKRTGVGPRIRGPQPVLHPCRHLARHPTQ